MSEKCKRVTRQTEHVSKTSAEFVGHVWTICPFPKTHSQHPSPIPHRTEFVQHLNILRNTFYNMSTLQDMCNLL